jgi:integrase
MALMKIKNVKAYVSKGRTYAYHRPSGTPLLQPYGSQSFLEELAAVDAAHRGQVKPEAPSVPGTWGELVGLYRNSPKFLTELATRTRFDYEKVLEWLRPLAPMPLASWDRAFVVRLRDKAHKAKGFSFGNYVVAVVGAVFTWGLDRDARLKHPVEKIKKLKRPKELPRANRPWTREEWAVVTAAAAPHLLAPILLAGVLGWREGEVVKRPRSDYDREARRIRRVSAKSGKLVKTPVPAALAAALNALLPHGATTLLVNSRGKPWTQHGFAHSFFTLIRELEGLGVIADGLTFHGLRHTMATQAREMGFDDRTIADMLGQNEAGMAEWYAREAELEGKLEHVVREMERHGART